ncbi:KTSC domain-containing protein [Streptomyces sp. NPDC091879]|uniref:KTSC domain-containing protein n=1 Tax=Streptomyces sp. NPDC091879 TaxID=3366006 RepID=UPI00380871D7
MASRNPRGGGRGRSNAYEQLSFDFGDLTPPRPAVEIPASNANPAARAGSRRILSQETSDAIQLAKDGDDFDLLPYQPTPSINPPRPRTLAAGYDKDAQTLRVRFRNGQVYGYYNVPPNVWRNFKRWKSPGRGINRVLNNFSYAPEHDLDSPTGVD